jgi:hypothetical protein
VPLTGGPSKGFWRAWMGGAFGVDVWRALGRSKTATFEPPFARGAVAGETPTVV